jgi:hypothetical protein
MRLDPESVDAVLSDPTFNPSDTMNEFCPKCGQPLRPSADPARLCDTCGWFGDYSEVLREQPAAAQMAAAVGKALDLFRSVCRQELMAEMLIDKHPESAKDMPKVRLAIAQAKQSLIKLFVGIKKPLQTILKRVNGLVSWPAAWIDYHYNACNEPCDFLVGPCSCGAWHTETEPWVQEALRKHNSTIEREP